MSAAKKFPGSIEKRGKSYRVQLSVAGKRHRLSIKTPSRSVAEAFARKTYNELLHQNGRRLAGLPDMVKMSDMIDRFEREELPKLTVGTQETYTDSLKPIRHYFTKIISDPMADTIQPEHIADYLHWRSTNRSIGLGKTDRGVLKPRSVNRDRAVLHVMFEDAEKLGRVPRNPVRKVDKWKVDEFEPIILTSDEYEALLTACSSPMLKMFVLLLGETGCRCESEALWLNWGDIDFTAGFITVVSGRDKHRTKSGESRQVPMTPRLITALKEHFAAYRFASQSKFVLHHPATKRHHKQAGRIGTLRQGFKNAAKRAKLSTQFRQHDLRHRRVTTWLSAGKSPALVQRAMGHSDIKTTLGYYRFLPEDLRSLVEDAPVVRQQAAGA